MLGQGRRSSDLTVTHHAHKHGSQPAELASQTYNLQPPLKPLVKADVPMRLSQAEHFASLGAPRSWTDGVGKVNNEQLPDTAQRYEKIQELVCCKSPHGAS